MNFPQRPKDIIMCCAVGASGYKREHTELTLKWTSVTHVDIYSKHCIVTFINVKVLTVNGKSLEVLLSL